MGGGGHGELGGWGHPQCAVYMAAARLGYKRAKVSTRYIRQLVFGFRMGGCHLRMLTIACLLLSG